MGILKIKKYPDKFLRRKCMPVNCVSEREKELFRQMFFVMKYFQGIGLAAPQVGIAEKLIIAEVEGKIVKLANPEIVKTEGNDVMEESCLSIPDWKIMVKRHFKAVVRGLDENEQTVEIKTKGLLARVLQHEIDHLSGKLIVDYLSIWGRLKFNLQYRRQYANIRICL